MIDTDINIKQVDTCTSCKFYYLPWYKRMFRLHSYGRCTRTKKVTETQDIVTGKTVKTQSMNYCSTERDSNHPYFCGVEAKFWQPNDTKEHLFTLLKRDFK